MKIAQRQDVNLVISLMDKRLDTNFLVKFSSKAGRSSVDLSIKASASPFTFRWAQISANLTRHLYSENVYKQDRSDQALVPGRQCHDPPFNCADGPHPEPASDSHSKVSARLTSQDRGVLHACGWRCAKCQPMVHYPHVSSAAGAGLRPSAAINTA